MSWRRLTSLHELYDAAGDDPVVRYDASEQWGACAQHSSGPVAWGRPNQSGELHLVMSGRPEVLAELLLAGDVGPVPAELGVEGGNVALEVAHAMARRPTTPQSWVVDADHHWLMMWTEHDPGDASASGEAICIDAAQAKDFLSQHYPHNYARAGENDARWMGWRDQGRLMAVGSWTPLPSGTIRLAGIASDETVRGQGYGRAITVALTRLALSQARACTLGVVSGNDRATRLYAQLGYQGVNLTYAHRP